ncbi:hypothetical protein K0M31_002166 [Melipona bicolor]|uniref:Uncharacterized protein n=1 Tax=Melipona bicolor TaxID=60889 RepID=A0AA40GH03_9HYME|nr:hypothetical protein K0M31_002166 [Melipona bicolor]
MADREFSRQKVFTGVGQEKAVKRHSKLPMRQFAYLSSGLSKALELDGGREWVGVGRQARRVLRFANLGNGVWPTIIITRPGSLGIDRKIERANEEHHSEKE